MFRQYILSTHEIGRIPDDSSKRRSSAHLTLRNCLTANKFDVPSETDGVMISPPFEILFIRSLRRSTTPGIITRTIELLETGLETNDDSVSRSASLH